MEVLNQIGNWVLANGIWVGLAAFVALQWVAFQILLVHYHFFRQNLKTPKPEHVRMLSMERSMEFQMSQMETLYQKLAELKKEMNDLGRRREEQISAPESLESRFMSLGEMKLKQRLSEIKSKLQ